MSYMALYRKFRPRGFEDVKGQDHIITTLKNQIKAERIGHAYLFCGTRGTGKTSVAKIFAKAVNCEQPVDGSPCGVCSMCATIARGTSMNVIEIDAASNNGVDNIREIREEVAYRPTQGRYKVYIIDEVHMLSIGAFNALLKTLEEPPEYVIFILATTEVHKIPVTILSRCQRYDFKRITIDVIVKRLQELMLEEKVEAEDKAVRYIAKTADGSLRDALSLLDQCIAFYLGETLTYDHALAVTGAVDTGVFSHLLRQVLAQNVDKVLQIIEDMVMQGRELSQFSMDFTWYLRNLLLTKSSDNMEDVLDVSTENLAQLKEESGMLDMNMLIRYIRIFSETSNQLKYAVQKRTILEVALIKLCKPEMEMNQDSLLDRLRILEEKMENGAQVSGGVTEKIIYVSEAQREAKKPPKPQLDKAVSADVKAAVREFRSIANEASGMLRTYLKHAKLSVGNQDQLLVVLPDEISAGVVSTEAHKTELRDLIENRLGKAIVLEIRQTEEGRKFEDSFVDLEQVIHMDITVEDEI